MIRCLRYSKDEKATIIYHLERDGESYAVEYISGLPEGERAKIARLLKFISDSGPPRNEQKFRHLKDGLYEIKSDAHRIVCFFGNISPEAKKGLILTHGFRKQKRKSPTMEIERGLRIKVEFEKLQGREGKK